MRRLIAIMAAMLLSAVFSGCQSKPRVAVLTRDGREVSFAVEIADTPAKRELGLQYRRELAPDRGMLFRFPKPAQQTFWMKNTAVPLDMIFIGADLTVVGIVENTTPYSLEGRSVDALSQFVLEINAGLSRRHGFGPGDRVRFDGFPADSTVR